MAYYQKKKRHGIIAIFLLVACLFEAMDHTVAVVSELIEISFRPISRVLCLMYVSFTAILLMISVVKSWGRLE